MLKEIKYLLYLTVIIIFFFISLRFYISDDFKKIFYRNLSNHDNKIKVFSDDLVTLKNDTENIIQYVDNDKSKSKKKYEFWKLLDND